MSKSKDTNHDPAVDTIWFTRCAGGGRGGVPTASGIAYKLGWLQDELRQDGIKLRTLQEDADPSLRHHHYDHALPTLIREGGNLFAIPARAQGARTRLIGLTWIDEGQSILVRPDSDIRSPEQLRGRRLALPAYRPEDIAENRRGRSIARHMSLRGYQGALASVGATLTDVRLVEVGAGSAGENAGGFGQSYRPLVDGEVDAIYVKGAPAADAARKHGLVVGIDLDRLPHRRFRVNNGTPRPVTVHEDFLENHYDLLVRFLRQTLRAADWAKGNLEGVQKILQDETGASAAGVATAYRNGFHLSLAPDLSEERVALFRQQKDFLLAHGVLDRDFDFDAWIDRGPLEDAARLLEEARAVA
jgi:ABC-type nitrate/sulfonate/bicarbonate transport system substrate-binding protein